MSRLGSWALLGDQSKRRKTEFKPALLHLEIDLVEWLDKYKQHCMREKAT